MFKNNRKQIIGILVIVFLITLYSNDIVFGLIEETIKKYIQLTVFDCNGAPLESIDNVIKAIDKIEITDAEARQLGFSTAVELKNRDKAILKGCEIAKLKSVERTNVKFSGADYDIQIVSINSIENGVEVFARVWDSSGKQIGFGRDGSIDIERFIFINPPVLVDDPNGSIVREWEEDGETHQRRLRENPQEALLQSLAHTIKVKKQKFGSENIVRGKIGNTTSTFYPDAHTESTSVDGYVLRLHDVGLGAPWSTLVTEVGSDADDSSATFYAMNIAGDTVESRWRQIIRGVTLFDTSSLPNTDTIDSATYSLNYNAKSQGNISPSPSIGVYIPAPASNTALVASDYESFTGTVLQSNEISYDDIPTSGYADWTLNSTGLGNISKTDITTKFGTRSDYDATNTAPIWADGQWSTYQVKSADTAGTSSDPKLVVEHSGGEPPANKVIFKQGTIRIKSGGIKLR